MCLENLSNYQGIRDQVIIKVIFFDSKEIKGFPVYNETETDRMGMKIKSIRELITIRKEKMSASLFELPKDYEKMEHPMNQM